jgi:hypothetical protein
MRSEPKELGWSSAAATLDGQVEGPGACAGSDLAQWLKLYASCASPAPVDPRADFWRGRLIEVRRTAFAALADAELYGHIAKAGLPKGYHPLSHAA